MTLSNDISIIIVNYNTANLLKNCIISILNNSAFDESTPLYVVDNGSIDNSVELLQNDYPFVHIIKNSENLGFGCANNQALRIIKTPIALLLNTDTDITNLDVGLCVEHLRNQRDVGMVGPALRYPSGLRQSSAYHFSTPVRVFAELVGISDALSPIKNINIAEGMTCAPDYIQGSVLFIKKQMLDDIGLFDEDFFFYHEEMELASRAHSNGYRCIYEPHTSAIHYYASTANKNQAQKIKWYYENLQRFYQKHLPDKIKSFKISLKISLLILRFLSVLNIQKESSDLKVSIIKKILEHDSENLF